MKEFVTRNWETKVDPKTGHRRTHRVSRLMRRYDREEKIQLVKEYLTGNASAEEIVAKYSISSVDAFYSWVGIFAKQLQLLTLQESNENDSDMANKSKDDQIRELKEQLRQAERRANMEALRAKAYSTMIDVAEQTFNIPVRKKSGTKQ